MVGIFWRANLADHCGNHLSAQVVLSKKKDGNLHQFLVASIQEGFCLKFLLL